MNTRIHGHEAALAFLLSAQDATGGFGFRPGGQAFTESTALACLCLHGHPAEQGRALAWLRAGQHRDGGWGVGRGDQESGWTTGPATWALAVAGSGAEAQRGAHWLLGHRSRAVTVPARISRLDGTLRGWSWTPDTFGWVPPTAFALLALNSCGEAGAEAAVASGRAMLLDRACSGGGWNYGNTTMIANEVPASAPETGQVLLALATGGTHTEVPEVSAGLDFLEGQVKGLAGALSLAWAALGLRAWGRDASGAAARLAALQGSAGDWAANPATTAVGALALEAAGL